MYNRYIPEDAGFAPVHQAPPAPPPERPRPTGGLGGLSGGLGGLRDLLGGLKGGSGDTLEGIKTALGGALKGFHLEELDLGDILLALIVLLLILEDGDGLDVIITLGLMILFNLGDRSCEGPSRPEEKS